MVADCLTKHLTLDEETQSIRDLLRTGFLHLRYTDEGEERTLSAEQRKQEGHEASSRESGSRPVPREMDSEDEASFQMHLPPSGSGSGLHGVVAFSKHTGVENRTEKVPFKDFDATTTSKSPQRARRPRSPGEGEKTW